METIQLLQKSISFMKTKIEEVKGDAALPHGLKEIKLSAMKNTLLSTQIVYKNLLELELNKLYSN